MNEIRTGKQAERYVANFFAQIGYFATILKQGVSGEQPFDIIGLTQNKTYCIDVKHCKTDYFTFNRVEENQKRAFSFLHYELKNDKIELGFVLVYNDKMYWFPYKMYELLKTKQKSVKPTELEVFRL